MSWAASRSAPIAAARASRASLSPCFVMARPDDLVGRGRVVVIIAPTSTCDSAGHGEQQKYEQDTGDRQPCKHSGVFETLHASRLRGTTGRELHPAVFRGRRSAPAPPWLPTQPRSARSAEATQDLLSDPHPVLRTEAHRLSSIQTWRTKVFERRAATAFLAVVMGSGNAFPGIRPLMRSATGSETPSARTDTTR